VPLVLPAPVPVEIGPLLIVPPLVVLPVVPDVELPPAAPPSAEPPAPPLSAALRPAALPVVIESASVLEVPLISELPLASESVATSPEPVLDSAGLPLPPQELKERAAPKRATARKLMRDLYIKGSKTVKKRTVAPFYDSAAKKVQTRTLFAAGCS
jgi:hypothetical protein